MQAHIHNHANKKKRRKEINQQSLETSSKPANAFIPIRIVPPNQFQIIPSSSKVVVIVVIVAIAGVAGVAGVAVALIEGSKR